MVGPYSYLIVDIMQSGFILFSDILRSNLSDSHINFCTNLSFCLWTPFPQRIEQRFPYEVPLYISFAFEEEYIPYNSARQSINANEGCKQHRINKLENAEV
ncbi:hypothetical protein TNCT_139281 [Trichonephila clavata]|uniref:Uncharacterized protein n=1 Tax=Trichonephila clavata TaxID=2740835 RepID=A0A8X6KFZ7_TRICU|nr:hypothetical protein TNCT_139281 [Trichonephila clavata]